MLRYHFPGERGKNAMLPSARDEILQSATALADCPVVHPQLTSFRLAIKKAGTEHIRVAKWLTPIKI